MHFFFLNFLLFKFRSAKDILGKVSKLISDDKGGKEEINKIDVMNLIEEKEGFLIVNTEKEIDFNKLISNLREDRIKRSIS